jgi:8-oxo-dGTP diphosphatase
VARGEFHLRDGKPDIAAAGGVVIHRDGEGRSRVAVIHRPKYGDWSLPKGKLEKGEGWQQAALREVQEEIGYECELGPELPHVSYLDRKSRRKLVRYWLMEPVRGEFKSHDEVDELRWLTPDEADALLTYPHDKELVHKAMRRYRWRRVTRALTPWAREPFTGA